MAWLSSVTKIAASCLLALVSVGLTGCAQQPISAAFDDLTSETSSRSSDFFLFKTFTSISGLVPQHSAQMLFHQPQFHDFRPDTPTHSIGISPKWSFVVERKYPMSGSTDETNRDAVLEIRDGFEKLRLQSAELVSLTAIVAGSSRILEPTGSQGSQVLGADDQAMLGKLLGMEIGKDDSTQAKKVLEEKRAQITRLSGEIAKTLQGMQTKTKQHNVIITRWSRSKNTLFGFELAPILSAKTAANEVKSGVLILGDIRAVSLHAGEDFFDMVRELNPRIRSLFADVNITTFAVQAKHIAYVADLDVEKSLSSQLKLTKAQLAKLGDALKDTDVNASLATALSMDIGNSAALSSPNLRILPRCFFPPRLHQASVEKEIIAAGRYQTVYAVRAQMVSELLGQGTDTGTELSQICHLRDKNGYCTMQDGVEDAKFKEALERWVQECGGRGVLDTNLQKGEVSNLLDSVSATDWWAGTPYARPPAQLGK
jgi:hypothetical protein